jgi:predicted GNAT family acetyltransferase
MIEITDDTERSEYVATLDGAEAGVIVYERTPGVIDLQHTIVRPEAEGHGVGSTLIRFALDAARASGERVVPTCPFVEKFLVKHQEYRGVVDR